MHLPPTTSDSELTLCMSQELDEAITEVQAALERLRVASSSAASGADWEVVSEPDSARVPRDRGSRPALRVSLSAPEPVHRRPGAQSSSSAAVPQTRADIAASFLECPQYCIDLCRSLSSPVLSAEGRAKRAWLAGRWFKAVLEGRVATPSPAPVLALRPVVYIVLRSSTIAVPCRFSTFASFKRAVGDLEGTDTLCQSFPSIAEARVFCCACAIPFDSLEQR